MKFERFVKKPVVVDTIQYRGYVIDCLKHDMRIKWFADELPDGCISIQTLDGNAVCYNGDYIIRGNQGELYTCAEKVFSETYERAPQRKRRTPKNDDVVSSEEVTDVFETEED